MQPFWRFFPVSMVLKSPGSSSKSSSSQKASITASIIAKNEADPSSMNGFKVVANISKEFSFGIPNESMKGSFNSKACASHVSFNALSDSKGHMGLPKPLKCAKATPVLEFWDEVMQEEEYFSSHALICHFNHFWPSVCDLNLWIKQNWHSLLQNVLNFFLSA